MTSARDLTFLDDLVLSRDFTRVGDRSSLYRLVEARSLVRVMRGAYLPTSVWSGLNDDERFLCLIGAVAQIFPSRPFSHLAAAALWRMPMIGAWPSRVEMASPRGEERRSGAHILHRATAPNSRLADIDGMACTALARTIVDVARTQRPLVSVAMADRALRSPGDDAAFIVTRDELRAELRAAAGLRGHIRAERVLEVADERSESPGESASRYAAQVLGFPAPILQQEFFDGEGLIGRSDFWWPDYELIGEFDGLVKYTRDEYLGGRTAVEIVLAEKRREDRLRALGPRVVRWGWAEALNPRRLERLLLGAGLPQRAGSSTRRSA